MLRVSNGRINETGLRPPSRTFVLPEGVEFRSQVAIQEAPTVSPEAADLAATDSQNEGLAGPQMV
jgi:hypothetical protein